MSKNNFKTAFQKAIEFRKKKEYFSAVLCLDGVLDKSLQIFDEKDHTLPVLMFIHLCLKEGGCVQQANSVRDRISVLKDGKTPKSVAEIDLTDHVYTPYTLS